MPHRKFGCDPAADAMTDEVKCPEAQRVEHLQIVEHHILDGVGAGQIVGSVHARMRWRQQLPVAGEPMVEGQEVGCNAMHVGEAMQIHGRKAGSLFEIEYAAAVHIDHLQIRLFENCARHFTASACLVVSSPNISAYFFPVASFSLGATSFQNRR